MPVSPFVRAAVVGGAVSAGIAGVAAARRWQASWGVDPEEASRSLPGDDLVPEPEYVETRGIEIAAPPEAVWPWLVQMGFGRGGWYSYDQLDMKGRSATEIVPEWQSLAVGDLIPTDPGGGFVVRVLEPGRALVLFVDPEIIAARDERAALATRDAPGLAASGRFLETATPPKFAVSWAFVLEPLDGGRTRLIERFRLRSGATSTGSRLFGPALTFGMFLMMRKQMLGIRERVEARAAEAPAETWAVSPLERMAVVAEATPAPEPPAAV